MGNLKEIFEAKQYKNYFSEIWAFLAQRADTKNSGQYYKKSVWATVVFIVSAFINQHVFIQQSDII